MKRKNSSRNITESLGHAFRGVRWVLASEPNFRIHFVGTFAVISAGAILSVNPVEWIALFLAAGFVLIAEMLNTSIEYLADAVHPEQHPGIGKAKDATAGAVLISAIAATAVGLIVFTPKLWNLFQTIISPNG